LDHQLNLIQGNPYLYSQADNSKGLRKAVLSRQTTIYYQIFKDEVQIISLFDNRQNPDKL